MKRVTGVLATALVTVLVSAGTALAQTYPPSVDPSSSVEGTSGSGGTAFTGASVSLGMAVTVAFLAVGIAALLVARRRAERFAA